jgi:hypothetical protein
MNSLVRVSRTSAYRGLSKVDRALKLMDEEGAGLRESAEAVEISYSKLFRAKKAREENREIGVHGRPRILNTKEEAELVQAIVDADIAGKPLTYKRLREVV